MYSEINNSFFVFSENLFDRHSIISLDEICNNNWNNSFNNSSIDLSSDNHISSLFVQEISTKTQTKDIYPFCSISKIKEILGKNIKDHELLFIFKSCLNLDDFAKTKEYNFIQNLTKKRKRYGNFQNKNLLNHKSNEKRNKRGRIPNPNKQKSREEHSKYTPDNIIKKIKGNFFNYGIIILNKILGNEKDNKLLKLNYEYVNKLNSELDLKYLKMSLKELFSMDKSKKFQNYKIAHNKIILDKAIERNDHTLNFVLDLTFSNFIELFTCKKNVRELINEKNIDGAGINYDKIQNSFNELENLLKSIMKKNNSDLEYFKAFIFYMFNYERWFCIKTPRKSKYNDCL